MPKVVRADFGKPVDPWFRKLKPEVRPIAEKLHALILSAGPDLRAEMKWGMPCYSKATMVCALMGAKAHIGLFFHYGKHLKDPRKLLSGSGKSVRSIKFASVKDIPATAVKQLVKAAVAFDARS
ncbi:MAG: DUF1801 domain-containing protein [Planctomycetaceae bacterium]|nr:DUF1801 domain-containing protein [Planctomycetaceae bacterium]